ncbi:MAG: DNA-directed RNA polymerase subunit beta' [Nitrospirae bacterium]|nr:DNA-directed RNA polymerase subunit beta' [Nitrospirota bacterium]
MEDIYSIFEKPKNPTEFEAIKIKLASPEKIRAWSYGEVKNPETINYRTFKPERDGLFCAKIFGPVKDWECICGKYKRMKHRGVVCDKCGVEVIRAKSRRERLGHIELATSVSHIWYLKSRPSIIGTLLDMTMRMLEKVLYFESYIVVDSGETKLKQRDVLSDKEFRKHVQEHGDTFQAGIGAEAIKELLRDIKLDNLSVELRSGIIRTNSQTTKTKLARRLRIVEAFRKSGNKPEWMIMDVIPVLPPDLRPLVPLEGGRFATSDLNDLYRRVINRNNRLKRLMELNAPSVIIRNEKRMLQEAVDALFDNGRRSRVLKAATKSPLKSLSDMIKGKQGRFRQNLLGKRVDYSGRSVIVPAPELKLHQCGLPIKMALELFRPFIYSKLDEKGIVTTIKDAKRLIDSAFNYNFYSSLMQILKDELVSRETILDKLLSLQEDGIIKINIPNFNEKVFKTWESLLKIVTYYEKKHKIPPTFRETISTLYKEGYIAVGEKVKELKNDYKIILSSLEEVTAEHPIILNRQPTLHRLGIQAFDPVLTDGKAIRLHPLVCKAFNADFDGDQMTVHVPLSLEAKIESRVLMMSVNNILSPANGRPVMTPTQDMLLGIYYLTKERPDAKHVETIFSGADEVRCAYDAGVIDEHTKIKVRINGNFQDTTTGRIVLHGLFPCGFPFEKINKTITNSDIEEIIAILYNLFGKQDTVETLDRLMRAGFEYATKSGISVCMDDIVTPAARNHIIEDTTIKESEYMKMFSKTNNDDDESLFTSDEQKKPIVALWQTAADLINNQVKYTFEKADSSLNDIYMMIDSGARGSWSQLQYIAGIKGLVADPTGEIIPYAITSNLRDGLSPFQYFISTYGARKGLTDIALRTANSGYLMRRLVNVAQEIVISEEDCGTSDGIYISAISLNTISISSLENRITGRFSAEEILHPATNEIILMPDKEITEAKAENIFTSGLEKIKIRSVLTCHAVNGVCAKCYGRNLSTGQIVDIGESVGIIAAQSIGEPATQLIMDSKHLNGSNGLPRIVELFEARQPKDKTSVNIQRILEETGLREAQLAILNELQIVYRLQHICINDKHFEIIIRKMTENIKIEDPGDTLFLRGETVHRQIFVEENTQVQFEGGKPSIGKPLLMGITKATLSTDSWISAASFQETTKVLTEAAINGAVDELKGLKENVIIGGLIPAGTGMPGYKDTFVESNVGEVGENL